jgi:excisionase family DNA binding protein
VTGTSLLTASDVAAILQVPVSWIYAEARAGRIPHVTLGRYRRFRAEAIEEWIAAAERGPKSSANTRGEEEDR